ncbi:DUF7562 family protein [Halomarina ordinaria]|uniref:Small CPxCG-related zinc finger protein n=1 Tax=Halomarina ordinaria TaxID=3033939 RepID=A0ABD5UD47_9EURY|nr:hypothetical protein [Halomarina sp. PSRA2]
MWGTRNGGDGVDCLACGRTVERSAAREYDKEGDRWSRRGKDFEYLCKTCHRELCHQPRDELEGLLLDIERDRPRGQREFLRRYNELVEDRYGSLEERGR